MKKATLYLLCFILSAHCYASHFAGGEIRYEYNGSNYTIFASLYKTCTNVGGVPLPNSMAINFKSTSLGLNFNRTLNLSYFDSANTLCAPAVNACVMPTSLLPGYITAYFKDTVSLPAANDWVISYNSAARIPTVNMSSSAANFYIESTLNNATSINSSPYIPNTPTYYMLVNTAISVPLQTLDAEGDSVAYELISPLVSAGTAGGYNTGYSLSSPFGAGGSCSINATTQTLNMLATLQGMYAVSMKIKDYRNGVLVGTYIREIAPALLTGTGGGITFPTPTSSSNFTIYTCPGQSNTITVNFTDATLTDSVFVAVTPPTLSGWTFTSTTTKGVAAASATISWTTPSSFNPATMPHFYIKLRTWDNGCPKAYADYSIVVRTRQCIADSVWPGDANGDFNVDVYDPLAIAIAAGKTGPTRTGASTSWTAQWCVPWSSSYVTNNINIKHGDCNGDGTIGSTDLGAVTSNYGLWHLKSTGLNANKTTGYPDLYFDLTGIALSEGQQVSIPIKFGNAASTVNNFYGLATRIQVDGITLSSAPTVTPVNGWVGNSSNTLNFTKDVSTQSVDWAYARTDQQSTSGQGTIAMLNFTVPHGLNGGEIVNFTFHFTRVVDKEGFDMTAYNQLQGTGMVQWKAAVKNISSALQNAIIVPNPSVEGAALQFELSESKKVSVTVVDAVGRTLWTHDQNLEAGQQSIALPKGLSTGLYMVHVKGNNAELAVMKWIKQ